MTTTNGTGTTPPPGYAERARADTLTDEDLVWAALETTGSDDARKRRALKSLLRQTGALERSLGEPTEVEAKQRAFFIDTLPVTEPEPPHLGRIADRGATLLFGQGGSGKGSYGAWLVAKTIRQFGWSILLIDSEERDYEWKPRFEALGLTNEQLHHIVYYRPSGEPLWEQVDEIQAQLKELNFAPDLVLVDSVARACGTDISTGDTNLPIRYYAALDQLCVRHLSIAHVGHNDTTRPLGARRWVDDCRLAWGYEMKGEDRLLINRKSNLGNLTFPKTLVAVTGWTTTTMPLPTDLSEVAYASKLSDIVYDALSAPMNYDDITEKVNEDIDEDGPRHSRDSVKKAMQRDPRFTKIGGTPRNPVWDRTTSGKANLVSIPVSCAGCHESADADQIVIVDTKRYHQDCAPTEIAS